MVGTCPPWQRLSRIGGTSASPPLFYAPSFNHSPRQLVANTLYFHKRVCGIGSPRDHDRKKYSVCAASEPLRILVRDLLATHGLGVVDVCDFHAEKPQSVPQNSHLMLEGGQPRVHFHFIALPVAFTRHIRYKGATACNITGFMTKKNARRSRWRASRSVPEQWR